MPAGASGQDIRPNRKELGVRSDLLAIRDFAFLVREIAQHTRWSAPDNVKLAEVERQVIEATLRRTGGNIKETAGVLGIDGSTLYEKIKKYQIQCPE